MSVVCWLAYQVLLHWLQLNQIISLNIRISETATMMKKTTIMMMARFQQSIDFRWNSLKSTAHLTHTLTSAYPTLAGDVEA